MAHEIETHGTQAAAVFARQDAWHRLGTTVRDRAFTAEEAMTLGHLGGWEVRKLPLTTAEVTDGGVTPIEVPGFAPVRTNPFTGHPEALGVVGGGYTPLQNEDHAEFLNLLADESGAIFDTAGSLRGGRQVFITMQLPDSLTVGGTDRIDLNIAALNSHDGTSAFRILVTPVRVVCANTQSAALSNCESSFSIRHTRNAKAAVQAAREALGLTFTYVDAFQVEAERLIQQAMTDATFDALIDATFGKAEANATKRVPRDRAPPTLPPALVWPTPPTQAGIRDTAWAGYQAVTERGGERRPSRHHRSPRRRSRGGVRVVTGTSFGLLDLPNVHRPSALLAGRKPSAIGWPS